MKTGRAVGHLIAIVSDLQFSFSVGGADHQFRIALLIRFPIVMPKRPGNLRTRLVDLGIVPTLAAIIIVKPPSNPARKPQMTVLRKGSRRIEADEELFIDIGSAPEP
jgi:hypothetical protein